MVKNFSSADGAKVAFDCRTFIQRPPLDDRRLEHAHCSEKVQASTRRATFYLVVSFGPRRPQLTVLISKIR